MAQPFNEATTSSTIIETLTSLKRRNWKLASTLAASPSPKQQQQAKQMYHCMDWVLAQAVGTSLRAIPLGCFKSGCLCCIARRQLRQRRELSQKILKELNAHPGYELWHTVITMRSCPSSEIVVAFKQLTTALSKLKRSRHWLGIGDLVIKEYVVGQQDQTHPHLNYVVLAPRAAFRAYDFAAELKKAMGIDYVPNVYEWRSVQDESTVRKMLNYYLKEAPVYPTKRECTWELIAQLEGVPMLSTSGVFRGRTTRGRVTLQEQSPICGKWQWDNVSGYTYLPI